MTEKAQGDNCTHGVPNDLCNPEGDSHGHGKFLKVHTPGRLPGHRGRVFAKLSALVMTQTL